MALFNPPLFAFPDRPALYGNLPVNHEPCQPCPVGFPVNHEVMQVSFGGFNSPEKRIKCRGLGNTGTETPNRNG